MEKIAVIGGLGTLAGGDLFFKLLKNQLVLKNQQHYHFVFEQQPYNQMNLPFRGNNLRDALQGTERPDKGRAYTVERKGHLDTQ